MSKTKKTTKKYTLSGDWLNMREPELFAKVREVFRTRGLGELPLATMARLALGEWLDADAKSAAKTPVTTSA